MGMLHHPRKQWIRCKTLAVTVAPCLPAAALPVRMFKIIPSESGIKCLFSKFPWSCCFHSSREVTNTSIKKMDYLLFSSLWQNIGRRQLMGLRALAHSLRQQYSMAGESWWQEHEGDSHISSQSRCREKWMLVISPLSPFGSGTSRAVYISEYITTQLSLPGNTLADATQSVSPWWISALSYRQWPWTTKG